VAKLLTFSNGKRFEKSVLVNIYPQLQTKQLVFAAQNPHWKTSLEI